MDRAWIGTGSASLEEYLERISRFPRITEQEERDLGARIQRGDQRALMALVEANLRFVVLYAAHFRGPGLSFFDLINEGTIGLIEAGKRFDPERGVRFINYAAWWIRRAILAAFSARVRAIRLPQELADLASLDGKTPADGARSTEFTAEEVNQLVQVCHYDVLRWIEIEGDPFVLDLVGDDDLAPADREKLKQALRTMLPGAPEDRDANIEHWLRALFGRDESDPP